MHVASVQEFLEYAAADAPWRGGLREAVAGPVIVLISKPPSSATNSPPDWIRFAFRRPRRSVRPGVARAVRLIAGTTAVGRNGRPYLGDAERSMLAPADLLVEHGPVRYGVESTIIDLSGTHPRLLREARSHQCVWRSSSDPSSALR